MTETEREIGLALLKRLRQRQLIPEETYLAAAASHLFDRRHFTPDTGFAGEAAGKGGMTGGRDSMAP